jgi:hypothetical protein
MFLKEFGCVLWCCKNLKIELLIYAVASDDDDDEGDDDYVARRLHQENVRNVIQLLRDL